MPRDTQVAYWNKAKYSETTKTEDKERRHVDNILCF